jgi:hypothetical protein
MAKPGPEQPEIFPVAAVDRVVAGLRDLLALARPADRAAVAAFAKALEAIHPAAAVTPPTQRLPVCRHLPAALGAARAARAAVLAEPLAGLAVEAFWAQNPRYRRRPPAMGFLEDYGYFVLAGPADGPPAFVECPDLACGLLLLGPGTLYPAHRHPAAELYIPLTGEGEWQRGEEEWRTEPAGAIIYHGSAVPHAMRAGRTPLLAAYLWIGDLATHARLSQPSG